MKKIILNVSNWVKNFRKKLTPMQKNLLVIPLIIYIVTIFVTSSGDRGFEFFDPNDFEDVLIIFSTFIGLGIYTIFIFMLFGNDGDSDE